MGSKSLKVTKLERRRLRVRSKVAGTAECPRLSVRRSLKHIYAQVIDDTTGLTLASASSASLASVIAPKTAAIRLKRR